MCPCVAVVDDEAAIVELLCELLQEAGYRTIYFRDVGAARASIARAQPDLVILDIRIGHGTDGWDLLRELRESPATGRIPVMVSTADAHFVRQHEEALLRYGVDVLAKPFDIDAVITKVGLATGLALP